VSNTRTYRANEREVRYRRSFRSCVTDTNIAGYNVGMLANSYLATPAIISPQACYGGWARGCSSIAQQIANQLVPRRRLGELV
jgi:hypothetical protein